MPVPDELPVEELPLPNAEPELSGVDSEMTGATSNVLPTSVGSMINSLKDASILLPLGRIR